MRPDLRLSNRLAALYALFPVAGQGPVASAAGALFIFTDLLKIRRAQVASYMWLERSHALISVSCSVGGRCGALNLHRRACR